MKTIINEIIHKIRTPAVGIKLGAYGIKGVLPKLVEAYIEAKRNDLSIPVIQEKHLKILENVIDNIESEANAINDYLDELLVTGEKCD